MEQQDLQLGYYLRLLWKGKAVILFTTFVAVLGVIVFSQLRPEPTPSYRATATVKVEPVNTPASLLSVSSLQFSDRSINTEILLISSRNVMERAVVKLQPQMAESTPEVMAQAVALLQKDISVRPVQNTNLLEIRAQASNPALAQEKADAIVEAYIDYVKQVRSQAIEDALDDIRAQLEGEQQPNGRVTSQLNALLPTLGSELSNVARSVEKSHQVIADLQGQQNPASVGVSLSQEVPQIQRFASELNAIAADLQRLTGDTGLTAQQAASTPDDGISQQAARLDKAAVELDMTYKQISEVRKEIVNLDPSAAFQTAITRSEDAQVVLRRVPSDLSGVRSGTVDATSQMSSIKTYTESVIDELQITTTRLREALGGKDLTQSEKVLMRGQMLANTLGLETAADELEDLRADARLQGYDGRDISKIASAEGNLRTAVDQITLLSTALDAVSFSGSLSTGLEQSLTWISQSSRDLKTVTGGVLGLEPSGDPAQNQDIATLASSELSNIALTLGVASSQLKSLQSGIKDPLLQAKLNSATTRLGSIQAEISSIAARLSGSSSGQTVVATLDGLRVIGDRIKEDAGSLSATLDILEPATHLPSTVLDANSASQAYANASDVTQSLDIASRQMQALMRGNSDPLLGGELGSLSDRLVLAHDNVKKISDRLAALALEEPTGPASGSLGVAKFRLEAAYTILQSAADSAQSDMSQADSASLQESAASFKEQTDGGIAILGLVSNDLAVIQMNEAAPVRYGQLAAVAEKVRLAKIRAGEISSQVQQFQEGRGTRYFELQQLRAELELSLLQPQETGITLVDSPVSVTATSSKAGFFSRVGTPAGVVAGFLLGCLLVLAQAQLSGSVKRASQLQDQLDLMNLGVVPKEKHNKRSLLSINTISNAPTFTEAIQLLGVNLSSTVRKDTNTVLITSPGPQEGKTTLAVNMAQVFAQHGSRVLLVDANLRKPDVALKLNLPASEGLSDALSQQRNAMDYIVETEEFAVLPGGKVPSNPVVLLTSPAMSFFLKQVKTKYDVVIVDGPPTVGFAETKALAKSVDGAVLVVKAGATSVDSVKEGKEELCSVGVNVLGAVLNFSPSEECGHLKHEKYSSSGIWRKVVPGLIKPQSAD